MDFWLPFWILLLLNFGLLDPPIFANGDADAGSGTRTGTGEPEEWNVINGTVKRNYTLTGIPQIDYVHDPNLPRELNGYNLSTYPFFSRVPKNINFSCDGLKDGFYASVEHKCQLYHHCLFGTRYDFLCANYTAFDQRTFICQFVSEVDCPNSALFFHRNDALYQSASTTTVAPVVIYVGPNGRRIRPSPLPKATVAKAEKKPLAPPQKDTEPESESTRYDGDTEPDYPDLPVRPKRRRNRRRCGPGRRRRCRRPRPRPEYYDYYDDDDYYDTDRRKKPKFRDRDREYDYEDYDGEITDELEKVAPPPKKRMRFKDNDFESRTGSTRSPPSKGKAMPMSPPAATDVAAAPPSSGDPPLEPLSVAANREKIFSKSRAPPKIRPPVPIHEKSKYDSIQGRYEDVVPPTTTTTTTTKATTTTTTRAPPYRSTTTKAPPTPPVEYEEYYDEEVEPPTTYRNNVLFGYLPTPLPVTRTTPATTTTTVATTLPPPPSPTEPQYEYEYEDYEDTTTMKPESIPVTSTARNEVGSGSRRFQLQQRQESAHVEDRRRAPGVEHQKINEALEAPSRASLRIPYHNKPRPSFLKNAQMLVPLTTEKETTSVAMTTSEKPSSSPFEMTFDGVNKRFPVFDTDTRLPLETVLAAPEKQRQRFRTEPPTTTTSQTILDEYMGFEEVEPEEMTERYGQNYPQPFDPNFNPPARRSSYDRQDNSPPDFQPPPQQQQHQRSRTLTFDLIRGNPSPSPQSHSPRPPVPERPEYISLLSEDEESPQAFMTPPAPNRSRSRSRFTQGMRTAPQQVFPSYAPAPSSFVNHFLDQYINSRPIQRQSRRRRQEGVDFDLPGQMRRSNRGSRSFYIG